MGTPHENYGKASKEIGKEWQEYKKDKKGKSDKLNYNTFRKELDISAIRKNYQSKDSTANEGSRTGLRRNNAKSSHRNAMSSKASNDNDNIEPMDLGGAVNPEVSGEGGIASSSAPHSQNLHGEPVWISRASNSRTGRTTITFRKKRIMYSYGYAFQQIDLPDYSPGYKNTLISTPLASLWVDYLPSYLSFAEFNSLPNGAMATNARVNVKVIGSRTSFEVGTELSGIANSEHVPIGIIATNINNRTYGRNVNYITSDATKPMVPTSVENQKHANILEKYYTGLASCAMGVPRSCYGYWGYYQNPNVQFDERSVNKVPFDYGQLNLNQFTDQFLINSAVGKTIKKYSYNIKHGLLNFPKTHVTSNAYKASSLSIMGGLSLCQKESVQRDKNSIYASILLAAKEKTVENDTSALETGNVLTDNFHKCSYTRSLERPVVYNPRNPSDNSCRIAQPQLHVGILAIPQLSPSTESENFQISTVYWEIEYELDVILDFNSTYTSGNLALAPNNVMFYNNIGQGYTSGHTFVGVDDEWKRHYITDEINQIQHKPNFTLRRSTRIAKTNNNKSKKKSPSLSSIVNTLNNTTMSDQEDYEYITMNDQPSVNDNIDIDECIEAQEMARPRIQRSIKHIVK